MKKTAPINGLEALDEEIERLEREAGAQEQQLKDQLDYLKEHYFSMLLDELLKRKKKHERHSFFNDLLHNEWVRDAASGMATQVAEKAGHQLTALVERLFKKKEG